MAKNKQVKEAGTPVVVALVFFVLTTIGLGVFCYVLYSDQEGHIAAKTKAEGELKNVREGQAAAEEVAVVYRQALGLTKADDAEKLGQIKEKAVQEQKEANDTIRKKLGTAAADEFDGKGLLKTNLLDITSRAVTQRDLAVKQTEAERANYQTVLTQIKAAADEYKKSAKSYTDKATEFPVELAKKIDAITKLADDRQVKYQQAEGDLREQNKKLTEEVENLKTVEIPRRERQIENYKIQVAGLTAKVKPADPFQFDEPQGKITNRVDQNVVEINIGSNAKVIPGLTFTILPRDFPTQGRQSRMQEQRIPDDRGVYRATQVFVPKGTIEVIEVLGPELSRARITQHANDIRDALMPGDLLYNAVWRKGHADHIALVGIFDLNGDGTDDIEYLVRELTKMGIPVDAYLDLKTGKWVGKLTDQTRMVVEGFTPVPTGTGNSEGMVKLVNMIATAKQDAQKRVIPMVNFRDFFGRTGFKARIDVSQERVNQAATRYLSGVATTEEPPPPGN